jgi:hypothetical protein
MKHFSWLCAGVLLLAIGCGKNLSDEQKAQFHSTMQSTGRSMTAVATAGGHGGGQNALINALAGAVDAKDEAKLKMASRLQQAVLENKCTISAVIPDALVFSAKNAGKASFTLMATGAQCPVKMNFTLDFNTTIDQMSGDLEMRIGVDAMYQVVDAEYKKLNDVTGFEFKGNITFSQRGMTNHLLSIALTADVKGKIHSESQGDLPLTLTSNIQGSQAGGASGELAVSLKYPDHSVTMKAQVGGDGKAKYTLNDDDISQAEFEQVIAEFFGGTAPSKSQPFAAALQAIH